ncbi:MAG: outer membrane beta-barrel protein [Neomegalonema sp.]|nr:outer membrane beta-barrel protein [Neomegalonema sp.]
MSLRLTAVASFALGLALAHSSALAEDKKEKCFDKGTLSYIDCPTEAAPVAEPAPEPVAEDAYSGRWLVRMRAIGVLPQVDQKFDGALLGTEVDIDNSFVPELDITYFFTKNFAIELILATTPHDLKTGAGTDLGSVWLLPPTLTAQYHFDLIDGVKPYVGAGVNYTFFYGADAGSLKVEYEDSFGFALQAGVDFEIGDGWYLNADVKKLFLSTDIKVKSLAGAVVDTGEVEINPWIVGIGLGLRF